MPRKKAPEETAESNNPTPKTRKSREKKPETTERQVAGSARKQPAKAPAADPDPPKRAVPKSRQGKAESPETAPTNESKPESPRKESRGSRGAQKQNVPEPKHAIRNSNRRNARGSEEELPVPIWRPSGEKAQAPASAATSGEGESNGDNKAPRRSKDRRRKDLRETEITAASALDITWREKTGQSKRSEQKPREPRESPRGGRNRTARPERTRTEPEKAPPAVQPIRERIPTPQDAPQVVMRDGVPTLVREHRVFPPISFFASAPEEENAQLVFEEIKLASERGVHLFVHLIELQVSPGAVDDAVALAGYLLKKTIDIDPEAQVMFRVVFSAPKGWESDYPEARFVAESGGVAEPSFCDDHFWGDAEKCLTDFIFKLRQLDTSGQVLGLHLERGEWFFADGWGYDTSLAAQAKFRQWARLRYREDAVSLRAAWFDGEVDFETIRVPEYRREPAAGEEFVRTGRKARRWVDYHLFLSDTTVERIAKLAHCAKRASDGYLLIGVSYGYTFEWSHPASGHLSLGKLLRTPEVDFIAGPPSYRNREPGGSAPFPCPIDSFALNGKLYISEEDFKTPISGRQEPDDFNPVMRTPQALESVHWRGLGAALAHEGGVCWMDLWGNGWLNTHGIWERGRQVSEALVQRMAAPVTEPDAAVFIDERSLAYLVDQRAFSLLVQNVREAILRSGLSVGFYLLSDLAHREKFPESKLYVFMNAWDIRPEVRSAIKGRLQRDGKVLFWLYAAGLFDGGRNSLERVREVTGIALKPQPFASKPGSAMLNRRHPLCEAIPDALLATGSPLEPSYFAIPEDGTVLAEYTQTGLPSYLVRSFKTEGRPELDWTSVFFGEPVVTPALFRALGQIGGAHVWNYQDDTVHVSPPFLTIHCSGAGPRTITLPDKWSAYNLLNSEWVGEDTTHVRFNATDGSTHVFLVGMKSEIESLLSIDPAAWLKLDELPQRADDTVHLESILLDVPIMKLDEWIEESWTEESVDDLLLKPSMLEIEAEAEPFEERGRRRGPRRRKGREDRGGTEETASRRREGSDAFDDLGMNVVFRKRE